MSIQCGWLRRSYWMVVVIHIIGSDKHIAMLSSAVIISLPARLGQQAGFVIMKLFYSAFLVLERSSL